MSFTKVTLKILGRLNLKTMKKNRDIYEQILLIIGLILLPGLIIVLLETNKIGIPTGIVLTALYVFLYVFIGFRILKR